MTNPIIRRGSAEEIEAEIQALEADQLTKVETKEETKPLVAPVETPANPEDATWKDRYGHLRSHAAKKETKLMKEIEDLKAQLAKGSEAIPSNAEDIKKWAEKNPQATAIIQALASEQVSKRATEIDTQLSELTRDKQEQAIRKKHPDYDEIVTDDAFHDWAETQRPAIQRMIYDSADPEDVIEALGIYKRVKGIKPIDEDKEAARSVRTRSTSAPDTGTTPLFLDRMINSNAIHWYEKNEAAIAEAIRTNRFEYDISGAAR